MPHQIQARSTSTAYRVNLSDAQGHEWHADEPAELGGGGTAPTPFQLLLSALAACTTVTLQMYANRKKWDLARIQVDVTLNPQGSPANGGNQIERSIELIGDLDDEQRHRLLQIAQACPVHKMLEGEVQIQTQLMGDTP